MKFDAFLNERKNARGAMKGPSGNRTWSRKRWGVRAREGGFTKPCEFSFTTECLRDGQSVHLEELMKALRTLGHDVILVGPPAFAQAEFGSSNSAVDRIKALIPAWLYEPLEIVYNLKTFLRLRAAVRIHRPDIIYERFSLYLFAGVWVRRLMGRAAILEANSPLFEERAKNDGLRLHRIGRWAQTYIWRSADHSFPVTGVLAKSMQDYGVPALRITVVPNGVDPARFPFNPAGRSQLRRGGKPR